MVAALRKRLENWAASQQPPQNAPIRLERRRVYILPTGFGYMYALMLMVMLLWAINYNNSMGFALTFLLSAVALNAMWRAHNNLLDLRVYPGSAQPVFAGQPARFTFNLENPDPQPRYSIALQSRYEPPHYADIAARGVTLVSLNAPAERRGLLRAGRLRIATRFPLGLFQAWSWVEFTQTCLVYPRPQGNRPLPLETTVSAGAGIGELGSGSEDYAGLRNSRPGDSPRHIAWKAAARARELPVKRFTDQAHPRLWLDWRLLAFYNTETRLSQLCQWVLKAEAEGKEYGLRLPGVELAPARGDGHRRRCLETLALYGITDTLQHADD